MRVTIQKELKDGLTISEACNKYCLSFKELVELVSKEKKIIPRKRDKEKQYIYRKGRAFVIQKRVNGKYSYFGAYSSFEDARKVRDELVKFNWNMDYLPLICRQLGVEKLEY